MMARSPRHRALKIIVCVVALAATACDKGGNPTPTPSKSPSQSPRPRSSATLRIEDPAVGASVPAGTLRVKLVLDGGRIVPLTSKDLKPDEGHIHLSLDDKIVSMTSTLEQDVDVAAGPHILQAEFVAADHAPFNPRVLTSVTFKAQ
jgi:hypothetical protein